MAKEVTPKPQQTDSPEKRYRVTVPNAQFSETVAGVSFKNGKAVIDIETIDQNLGRTPDQIAVIMRDDFGYSVEEIR